MNNFSMDWFKQELAKLQIEEQRIKNEMMRLELEKQKEELEEDDYDECDCCDDDWDEDGEYKWDGTQDFSHLDDEEEDDDYVPYVKPYMHLKMVNDVLTIVLNDGQIISKPNATQDDFKAAQNASNEADLFTLVMSQEVREDKMKRDAEVARMKSLQKGLDVLKSFKDFTVDDYTVYLKGISRSLPQIIVEEFIAIIGAYSEMGISNDEIEKSLPFNESYQALKRFFMWCCLNPRAEVAHELYRFLKENSFRITKQGFFVALRNVVSLCDDTAIWKKDPSQMNVWKDSNDYLFLQNLEYTGGDNMFFVGNLTSLYLELPEMKNNRYTDAWTKTFDIRVGVPVNMPISDCNWSTQDCAAAGLHFTADHINYVGCGDTSMLILINPMKVVGIGEHKGRCYEYLPLMTVPTEESTTILHDLKFDTLELDDQYAVRELESLSERAQAGFVAESRKYDFNIPNVSIAEIKGIAASLEEMKGEIANRVKSIN
ncbi:MAG: hypothetical protein EB127_01580 [Alphaproteobacteria bacterium]|nr:hypothetical protein [Alphaproteobacteria bacterium]